MDGIVFLLLPIKIFKFNYILTNMYVAFPLNLTLDAKCEKQSDFERSLLLKVLF